MPFPQINSSTLESICQILGESFTGSKINKYLKDCDIPNQYPTMTKWKRLNEAFYSIQKIKGNSNDILRFIETALHPSLFIDDFERFKRICSKLNMSLAFIELRYCDDGKFRNVEGVETISDAIKITKQSEITSFWDKENTIKQEIEDLINQDSIATDFEKIDTYLPDAHPDIERLRKTYINEGAKHDFHDRFKICIRNVFNERS